MASVLDVKLGLETNCQGNASALGRCIGSYAQLGISYDNSFLLAFGGDTVYHIPYVEHGGTGNESVSYVGTVVSLVGIAADFSGIVRGFYLGVVGRAHALR